MSHELGGFDQDTLKIIGGTAVLGAFIGALLGVAYFEAWDDPVIVAFGGGAVGGLVGAVAGTAIAGSRAN